MSEERARILQMVSQGQIDAAQGVELLNALNTSKQPDLPPQISSAPNANWFRVRVTDIETGRTRVNVNIPFSLVKAGIKLGARFSPEMAGVELDELIAAIDEGALGQIVDVEDIESGEKVQVFVE
jgi:hypothetical protein